VSRRRIDALQHCLALLCALLLLGGGVAWHDAAQAEPLPASGTVEALFTPWDDAEGAIVRALGEARQSIHLQAYLLTSRVIARALSQAHRRGVEVAILTDAAMLANDDHAQRSQIPWLVAQGVPVWLETRYAAAHNKIVLIDAAQPDGMVITGSYNFTWSAQARNAENLLILRGNRALQQRYLANWQRHRAEAEAYRPTMESSHD
jgi:phosphatidylserine/phosphatidylglycerophosphate/cardiolipin synthase-like enzyme